MRLTRRIPRGALRATILLIIAIAVIKICWLSISEFYTDDITSNVHHGNPGTGTGNDIKIVNRHLIEMDRNRGVSSKLSYSPNHQEGSSSGNQHYCRKVVTFDSTSRDTISTFDLPDITDYSLDANGRYKIPAEFLTGTNKADETIQVIVVPFSHADPGYGLTFEGYYQQMTKHVLNNMIVKLTEHRNMTFQWAETVFLERWFRDITDAQKQQVRDLAKRGQLEIVMGGWVMPDEAITYYVPVVDQLIEGHQWLVENIGVTPKNAWINDPFGYSSTMPYLWKASGMDNMVILRIHQAIKATLMRKKSMEFNWRPYWKSDNQHDILCNLMPYPGYWNGDVCGPDQSVCKQFNFLHLPSREATAVTDQNISRLSKLLYEAYTFTASLYQYNNLVIFIGEDNSYTTVNSWDDTYKNYDKLMKFINNNPEWNMNIKFGTLKEYFANVRENEQKVKRSNDNANKPSKFPILSGDFFPYSDWSNGYWTGFYTTRPWVKKFSRELGPIVRAADIFSVILYNFCISSGNCPDANNDIVVPLNTARRELGMYQHHDGITGTSLDFVVNDYETRLLTGYKNARLALKMAVMAILSRGKVRNPTALNENQEKENARSIVKDRLHVIGKGGLKLIIVNPLEKPRVEVVNMVVSKKNIKITTFNGKSTTDIPFQVVVSHAFKSAANNAINYLISFKIELAPFVIQKVDIEEIPDTSEHVQEELQEPGKINGTIEIENSFLRAVFDSNTGMLERIIDSRENKITEISAEFLKYRSQTSGAYLFGPSGNAEPIPELSRDKPQVFVTRGLLMSEVRLVYNSGFSQSVRLYNTKSVQGQALHIRNEIDFSKGAYSDTEVILRFKTDIQNGNIFFTDQNGFQIMGRKTYSDRLIESNYYPMTTMAILEDSNKRMTLHSSQPHGVASLKGGWLEVMLDRNMHKDDGKGLGRGVNDKVPTLSEFILQVEYKTQPEPLKEERYTHMTMNSMILNEQFQNGIQIFAIAEHINSEDFGKYFDTFDGQKMFPCDTAVVGLRNLVTNYLKFNGTSLVLHRRPVHCSYPAEELSCSVSNEALNFENFLMGFDVRNLSSAQSKVTETSLSHIYTKTEVTLKDDIRPDYNELKAYLINFKAKSSSDI